MSGAQTTVYSAGCQTIFLPAAIDNVEFFNGKIVENIINPIVSVIGLGAAEEIVNVLYNDFVVHAHA